MLPVHETEVIPILTWLTGCYQYVPEIRLTSFRREPSLFQGVFKGTYGALLHSRQHVTVGVEGDSYGGVAKHFRDDFRVYIAREEKSGAGVPKVVEAGIGWKTGTFEESSEGAVSEVGRVDDAADLVGENEAAGSVEGAHPLHLF